MVFSDDFLKKTIMSGNGGKWLFLYQNNGVCNIFPSIFGKKKLILHPFKFWFFLWMKTK